MTASTLAVRSETVPPSSANKLLLVDSASLYFRAFFGVPDSFQSPDGIPVNAARGFFDMVARLVSQFGPSRLVACWDDDWRPAFRVDLLPSYKAHRLAEGTNPALNVEQEPPGLAEQVPVIVDLLEAFGIARVGCPGFEADDVIGTLATREPGPIDVVSGDRDLIQLVDDERGVRVLYTGRGMAKLEALDEATVSDRYGIPGRAYADFAALRGDPSDGLPGVAGVGDKTAAGLISRWGSVEALIAALDADDPTLAQRTKLAAARDYLLVAPTVVRVCRECPIGSVDTRLPAEPRDPARLVELADRWGLESTVNRMLVAMRASGQAMG